MTTPRDGNTNRYMAGQNDRPHPAVGDRIEAGRNPDEKVRPGGVDADRMKGVTGMAAIARDPHSRGSADLRGHISDAIRSKLGDHPAQAGHIRDVADRRR